MFCRTNERAGPGDAHAFLAEDAYGLRVIDISDPTPPVSVGIHDTPGQARAVDMAGDYAYVADYGSGLRVLEY